MNIELGVLKAVTPRKKWPNEAQHFTPWLSENIHELNKVLGLELEVESTEVAAGPYSADILARDIGSGKYVIIENQLEKTNHDHLGKSITYASVLDASTIIWVATNFTEEHKKSLDWLNDHTTDDIYFYGVQLELWQIDDSKVAVKFNVISRPNQAVRQAAKSKATGELSDNRKFQLKFWNNYIVQLAKTKKIPSIQTPRPAYWFNVTLGKSNIYLSNTCNTDTNTVGVRVYIRNKIADSMLPFLESQKDLIEKELGVQLEWNPNPENQDKTIALLHNTDFGDPEKVNEAIEWLVKYTVKFRSTFSRLIQEAP